MNRADRNRASRWELRRARLHREREQAATDMANMARMMDRGRAVADAIVWGALEMMSGEKRRRLRYDFQMVSGMDNNSNTGNERLCAQGGNNV